MLEFFFDCSSPWTYLAFVNIQPMANELGVEITWKPFLVGGVFNTVNKTMYETRANPVPAKQAYTAKDMQDWARLAGIKIKMPPTVFPVNAVKSMRGCIWVQQRHPDKFLAFATAVFEAYWGDDQDISQDAVLTKVCERVGIDPQAFLAGIGEQGIKDQLKANTDDAISRGAFGSPTIYLDKTDMYFGNDRLPLVHHKLMQKLSVA
ncbi:MAG: 2-hydroxychromene-2-carboxylate isomerase [Afipia sp. 62-7]|nr:2-hydroxychromene-2-carboxylate isomerase [Afipia sp.]OJU19054.1 MAG: 2-hydroxychromene-2-carboxylate isomerase [Afipia sp. 62-7]